MAGEQSPAFMRMQMNNTEKLISLLDKDYEGFKGLKLDGDSLLEYYRSRKNPKYLFSIEDAEKYNCDAIFKEAEKTMNHDIFGWKFDGEIDYLFNPTTETSRDNEWSWSLFRTIYWQPLARAYAVNKDEKYFREFIHEMKQFNEVWPADKYIEDHTFEVKTPFPGHAWRTIESGIRIYTTWLPCFEIFRHSKEWKCEDLAEFLLAIRNHALFLMGHYSNHDRSSNWLSMEASALYQIGVMFPEFSEAKEWRDTGYERVMHEVMYCFSDSGVHMEKTPIYHLVAAIAFMQAIRISEINGIVIAPYAKEIITRAAEYVMSLIKPDLSTPMIGDADRDDLTTVRSDTSIYEGMNLSFFPDDLNELRAFFRYMYNWTGKEEFLYFASLRHEGKAPEKLDWAFREEGIFVVRSNWSDSADYGLMHSVKLERGERSTHSHNDSGHVDVTLKGEDILVDSGRFIYRSSIWKDWRAYFCSALAHNTLYVDDHEMGEVPNVTRVRGVRAICNSFGEDKGVKVIDISHNGYVFISDPVFHRRKLFILPNHKAVIVDYVTGKGEEDHDFRLSYNFNQGSLETGDGVVFKTSKGTEFVFDFVSDVEFKRNHYYGSEEPKGGWISYGYPVKVPNHQLVYSRVGKAPFTAVTAIAEKSSSIKAEIKNGYVSVKADGKEYRIYNDGLEIL